MKKRISTDLFSFTVGLWMLWEVYDTILGIRSGEITSSFWLIFLVCLIAFVGLVGVIYVPIDTIRIWRKEKQKENDEIIKPWRDLG